VTALYSPADLGAELVRQIQSRGASVGVVGGGYVGLSLSLQLVRAGFEAFLVDSCRERVRSLLRCETYADGIPSTDLDRAQRTGRFHVTDQMSVLRSAEVIVLALPTPLRDGIPDLSAVEQVCTELASFLKRGCLVCFESTSYPGTTRKIVLPLLESSGLRVESDFFLTYSPERIDPANAAFHVSNTPRLLSALGPISLDVGRVFYETFLAAPIHCTPSVETAEMAKLYENTFRFVNIGLVNELTILCDKVGADVWEVLQAAHTKPFGWMPFFPGPGAGGHCIPVAPTYLSWFAGQVGVKAPIVAAAQEVNLAMPDFIVQKASEILRVADAPLKAAKILMLGVAYKKNVGDVRESGAVRMLKLLQMQGCALDYCDPLLQHNLDAHAALLPSFNRNLNELDYKKYDLVIIATDHDCFDYRTIVRNSQRVLDLRNATKDILESREKIHLL